MKGLKGPETESQRLKSNAEGELEKRTRQTDCHGSEL